MKDRHIFNPFEMALWETLLTLSDLEECHKEKSEAVREVNRELRQMANRRKDAEDFER